MTIELKSNIKTTATFSIEKGLLDFLKLKFKKHGEFSKKEKEKFITKYFKVEGK